MPDQKLRGQVIVITGASSGFGKGAALKFAQSGAHVVLAARRDELLSELAENCTSYGVRALVVPTDVSKPEDVQNLAASALREFGDFDCWINNAGVGTLGEFTEVPLDDHIQVIRTDLIGTMCGSFHAISHFKNRGRGVLINIASVLGVVPHPHYSSYAAAKHGVVGLSGVIRQEVKQHHPAIHVCTVLPTSTDTTFFQHAGNYTGRQLAPTPPIGDAEDVIDVIVDLATNPKDHVAVGAAAKAAILAHHIAPDLTESRLSESSHQRQENIPPAEPTEGSVHEPSPTGTGVSGGWRKK